MGSYYFDAPSVISDILIRRSAGGGMRIFIHGSEGLSAAHIDHIKSALEREGGQCVAGEFEGRDCLEVRGIRKLDVLEKALRSGNMIYGAFILDERGDPKFSLAEKVKSNLLWVCGLLNVTADIGFVLYGYLKNKLEPAQKHWEDQAAGVAYAAGSIALATLGRGDKSDHHLLDICLKLRGHLNQEGVTVHEDGALQSFIHARDASLLKRGLHFLNKHPSEVGNLSTAAAGAFIAAGAFRSGDPKTKVMDTILGASTLASGMTAALIKEDHPSVAAAATPKGVLEKAWRWVKERPNRIAGYGYMISTFAHGIETVRNIANAKQKYPGKAHMAYLAYGLRGFFTALNFFAEIAMSLAPKITTNAHMHQTTYAIAADAIARQPEEMREELILNLSRKFLSQPDVIGDNADTIAATLRAATQKLLTNRWARLPQPAAARSEPDAPPETRWQNIAGARPLEAVAAR